MSETGRLVFEVSEEWTVRIAEAAELVDEPLSEFVRTAAQERADAVLSDTRVTRVPCDYFDRLLAALDEPDEPNVALRAAARRLDDIVRQA